MWLIFKVDKKRIEILKRDFKLKLGEDTIFYRPKLLIEKYHKNKLNSKDISLLGDYMFCYNKKLVNESFLNLDMEKQIVIDYESSVMSEKIYHLNYKFQF